MASLIGAATLIGGSLGVGWALLARQPVLAGTVLEARPAPPFRLHDSRGAMHALADLRGRPVVLAFLYANCPDVCRLTAAGLHQTALALGEDVDRVAFVAVSVDPVGDDATAIRRFLVRQKLQDRLLYLNGPADDLPEVWQAYYLFVNQAKIGGAAMDLAAHTDALYLIDAEGRLRSLLHSDLDPDELAASLRTLLRERRSP